MTMHPDGRILICLTGGKSYYLWNGTETYYKKLRSAYLDISNNVNSEYLYFGFFTLCASTLEYSLNFILTDFCVEKFGPDDYKIYCNEYLNLHFRNKLFMLPHIISNGEYITNEDNSSFKKLEELISLRNRILHNKESLKELDIPKIQGEVINDNFVIAANNTEIEFIIDYGVNYIDTLTKEKCISFGNALGDFKTYLMTPALNNELQENPMIKKNTWKK